MFGKLKENFLNKLENNYEKNGKNSLNELKSLIKIIKKDKNLLEYNKLYDLLENTKFDNFDTAKSFIDECVSLLEKLDKNSVNKLKIDNDDLIELNEDSIKYKLDQIIFNDKLYLSDKLKLKLSIANDLTTNESKEIIINKMEELTNKIDSELSSLNEEQKFVLELFLENDANSILEYNNNIIQEINDKIDQTIVSTDDIEMVKTLINVKQKALSYKKENPTINEIDELINLKNNL